MAQDLKPVRTLTWGVKQSFRNYVKMTEGVTEVGGGASQNAEGEFVFTAAPDSDLAIGPDGALTGTGRFIGEVKFEGHGGMLKVFLADPVLEVVGTEAKLTVAETPERKLRGEIARLDLAGGDASALPAALAMDGVFLLGSHYPLRTALDPVRLG